jgi:hypothetical protein
MRTRYGSDDFLQHFEMLNTLMAQQRLKTNRGSWIGLFSQLKGARMKRRLLNARRMQLKAASDSLERSAGP